MIDNGETIIVRAQHIQTRKTNLIDLELCERYLRLGGFADNPVIVYEGDDALEQLQNADIFGVGIFN